MLTLAAEAAPAFGSLPFAGIGLNLPRNLPFQGYGYAPSAMEEGDLYEIAAGLGPGGVVRSLVASPRDWNARIPTNLTAGPGGAVTWDPGHANLAALATTIQRANAAGLVWWQCLWDGVVGTYDVVSTWATRGDQELYDYYAAAAAWFAARFTPQQLVLAPWNESKGTDATAHNAVLNKVIAAMRVGAPNHWIIVGTHTYASDWSTRIADLVLDTTAGIAVEGHAYANTDATWASGLAAKVAAAGALGVPFIYGELDAVQANSSPYDAADNATRLARMNTAFAACRAAGVPALAWNDANSQRCLDIVAATQGAPRSVAWVPAVLAAMGGGPLAQVLGDGNGDVVGDGNGGLLNAA